MEAGALGPDNEGVLGKCGIPSFPKQSLYSLRRRAPSVTETWRQWAIFAILYLMVYHIRVDWVVDFYQEPDGSAPVEEFLESLRPGGRAKALALIQALKMHGPSLPFPYSSQAAGKIRELRTQSGKDKIRILYFADAKRTFILLHGFVKRTPKLEASELGKALDRMARHNQGTAKKGKHRE